jgi:hypothetical protein
MVSWVSFGIAIPFCARFYVRKRHVRFLFRLVKGYRAWYPVPKWESKMARRKRIGRPPKPAKERKSVNFTFRSRGDMRQKLRDAAALGGRSISEEIERRLDLSFQQEQMAMEAVKAALKLLVEEREVAKEVTSKKIEEE